MYSSISTWYLTLYIYIYIYIYSDILSAILSDILSGIYSWHSIWQIILVFYLALSSVREVDRKGTSSGPARTTAITRFAPGLAVRAWQGPLRSCTCRVEVWQGRVWSGACCSGPTRTKLAVEVRQGPCSLILGLFRIRRGPLRSSACSWGQVEKEKKVEASCHKI